MIDFAEQQERARHRTALLLWVYVLATGVVSLLVMLLLWLLVEVSAQAVALGSDRDHKAVAQAANDVDQWIKFDSHGLTFMAICIAVTMLMIFGSSWWKYVQLLAGGRVVAESMGGRLVPTSSRDPAERRVLNVVEEMALAANIPVPPVYIMNGQSGINAFAAGRSTQDAVVGLTEGAMRRLTRDQLQGVVGHEFSHILNGDMRLNLRLIGMLHGLLAVCVLGRVLCDIAFDSDTKKGFIPLFVFGLLLMLIGYTGWAIGRFIQACVSRQREFLADASSVEFTRNPQGITDALRAIGGASALGNDVNGARVKGANLDGYRHMFFASSLPIWATGLMSTHPPLKDRIKRLDERWDGSFITPPPMDTTDEITDVEAGSNERGTRFIRGVMGGVAATAANTGTSPVQMPNAMSIQGVTGTVERSRGLLMRLPDKIGDALREPCDARLVIFAILLIGSGKVRDAEAAALTSRLGDHEAKQTLAFAQLLLADQSLARSARLPMIQVALSSLSSLSIEQFTTFREDARSIINADGKIDLNEWLLVLMVEQQLSARMGAAPTPRELRPLKALARPCAVVLWTLAHAGQSASESAASAARLGADQLMLGDFPSLAPSDLKRDEMEQALTTLAATPAPVRAKIMSACEAVAGADGQVTDRERDLLLFLSQMLRTRLQETMAAT